MKIVWALVAVLVLSIAGAVWYVRYKLGVGDVMAAYAHQHLSPGQGLERIVDGSEDDLAAYYKVIMRDDTGHVLPADVTRQ